MANKKGLIVYFDGPDGVGKTTQLNMAADRLRSDGHDVFESRTVGGTPIGEILRTALLSDTERPAETDLHIAVASQYAQAEDVLKRRENGQVVLIDRSPLSIIAYQVYGDGLDKDKGLNSAGELFSLIKPEIVIVYMAEDGVLLERRHHRNGHSATDHFENKSIEYHANVAEGFRSAGKIFGAVQIEAGPPMEKVHANTMEFIQAALEA
jgi:dTMP kinase